MNIKNQIRAEIERRLSWRITLEARAAYNNILRFLDTLPEQPAEGLEEEIERFYRTDEYRIADTLGRGFETLARHFAEWGRSKMLEDAMEGVAEELYNDGEIHCTIGVGACFQPGQEVYVIKKED